jgi:uncharacterized membrane protein YagU involved in acid resistance
MILAAIRGAAAGAAATWVMDLVTTGYLSEQPEEARQQEEAAQPNGQSSVANLLDRIEGRTGLTIAASDRGMASQVMHYGLGIVPAAVYGVIRERVPLVGSARGLLFGMLVFALMDEYLNTQLGLSGPPEAYPAEAHLRGAIGHAVYGLATDTAIELLGG